MTIGRRRRWSGPARPGRPRRSRWPGRARRRARRQGHVPAGQDLRRRPDHRRAAPARGARPRPDDGRLVAAGRRRRRALAVRPRRRLPAPPGAAVRRGRPPDRPRRRARRRGPRAGVEGARGPRGRPAPTTRADRVVLDARRRLERGRTARYVDRAPTACGRRCASCSAPPTPGLPRRVARVPPVLHRRRPARPRDLWVWFEPDLLPGYAWSFPLPGRRRQRRLRHPAGRPRSATAGHEGACGPTCSPGPTSPSVLGPDAERRGAATRPGRSRPASTTSPLAAGRVLFVGDAAAATDPMTGEGIGQALLTGMLAAEAIVARRRPTRRAPSRTRTSGPCAAHLVADHRCRCC